MRTDPFALDDPPPSLAPASARALARPFGLAVPRVPAWRAARRPVMAYPVPLAAREVVPLPAEREDALPTFEVIDHGVARPVSWWGAVSQWNVAARVGLLIVVAPFLAYALFLHRDQRDPRPFAPTSAAQTELRR